jgi:hypothetical protein
MRSVEAPVAEKTARTEEAATPMMVQHTATRNAPHSLAEPQAISVAAGVPSAPKGRLDGADGEQLEAIWTQLVEAVGRVSPFMRSYLLESHPVSFTKNVFTLGFDPEFRDHMTLVDTPKNRTVLETKIREMGHRDASVRLVQAEAPPHRKRPEAPEEPASKPFENTAPLPAVSSAGPQNLNSAAQSKGDFKNDPLIKKALEIFKGTIVEVRAQA